MISSVGNAASSWTSAVFSKLDTKNQGYLEKSDLEAAFAKVGGSSGATSDTSVADKVFEKLDTDSDGKVTKDEMSAALEKVASQLNAQFDQSRVRAGMGEGGHSGHGGPGDMPPPDAAGGAQGASGTQGSSDSSYIAAADTNGEGTVSAEEKLAYEQSGSSSTASAATSTASAPGMDGMQALLAASRMPPPPPQDKGDAGFSKDELTSQIQSLGATDSKRSEFLTSLANNFDKADANGDGKIDRGEAHAFRESSRAGGNDSTSGSSAAAGAGNDNSALSRIVQLLRMYGTSDTTDTASATGTLNMTA